MCFFGHCVILSTDILSAVILSPGSVWCVVVLPVSMYLSVYVVFVMPMIDKF
jgi:hypothetical protein